MSVSISEILAGASAHAVPLAGECAGYLVLAAADQAVAAPRRIGPGEVRLFDDGTVRVEGAQAAGETDAEADLRALLDALLLQASSSTPALVRASRRAPGRGIAALVREIETALIPVNRAAAHRALARLQRETERARKAGRLDARALDEFVRNQAAKADELPCANGADSRVEKAIEKPSAPSSAAADDEIPSLFAPPVAPVSVESIARLAEEIETRPEPVVLRRSAPPPFPSKTPSPPPFPVRRSPELPPVALRSPSPPPAHVQPTTPVFGTVLRTFADDEMEIEIVVDEDELLEDELTGVLVRSTPLEVSAMPGGTAMLPDPTEPCPPVQHDETAGDEAPSVSESSVPETTALVAEAAKMPDELGSRRFEEAEHGSIVASNGGADAEMPIESTISPVASESMPIRSESAAVVPVETTSAPVETTSAPVQPVEPECLPNESEGEWHVLVETAAMPPVRAVLAEQPSIEMPLSPQAPSESLVAEPPGPDGETLALALAIDPLPVEATPAPHIAMPSPRPSDVEDLLERMTQASVEGGDDLRATLKGIAGIEPTPAPPDT